MQRIRGKLSRIPKISLHQLAFLLTIVLVICNQMTIQRMIAEQKNDAHVINLAGRQRVLSQQILHLAYLSKEDFSQKTELDALARLWHEIHVALQKGTGLHHIPIITDPAVQLAIHQVSPYHDQIYSAVQSIKTPADILSALPLITTGEKKYLPLMNHVADILEDNANKKIRQLVITELFLAAFLIGLLLLEYFFVFRPLFNKVKRQRAQLEMEIGKLRMIAEMQSHEVRRPVANILGSAYLINYQELDEENKTWVKNIVISTKELDKVIHKIVKKTNEIEHSTP